MVVTASGMIHTSDLINGCFLISQALAQASNRLDRSYHCQKLGRLHNPDSEAQGSPQWLPFLTHEVTFSLTAFS
jgi:hypothetical protein